MALGILAAGLLTPAIGCVAWHPQSVGTREVLAAKPQDVIRVKTAYEPHMLVYRPKIVADTLTGHPSETAIQRLAIPVRDITEVSTRYRHIGKSLLAGIAIVTGVLLYSLLQGLNGTA
jgi:hypothetical protein